MKVVHGPLVSFTGRVPPLRIGFSPSVFPALALLLLVPAWGVDLHAADLQTCRDHLIRGRYFECIRETAVAIDNRRYGEDWPVLMAQAQLATGAHAAAAQTIEDGLKRYSWSVRLRLLAHDVYRATNQPEQAAKELKQIDSLVTAASWRYSDVDDLVTLGRAALLVGADARSVLEGFYDKAKQNGSRRREPHLASGELALMKHDRELAAEFFGHVLKLDAEDPDAYFGMARALESVDRKASLQALAKVLELNPNHVPAMLYQAEQLIDSEHYAQADESLDRALAINDKTAEAWALKAVIAHLSHEPRGEATYRAAALGGWQRNPFVDHLIGRKLSGKYRFREGAAYQKRALELDENYLPARIQLAQDLLRLGEDTEGWQLATKAHQQDGYDSVTFNLLELHDELIKFRTIETEDFIIRMDPREADVYGDRVVKLLTQAKQVLCNKYDLKLSAPITVEIFPDENDFAVRTFGMPAVSGYLGVCFGRVITANSPASRVDRPSNWEAVLWHEFCHVVTLELTRNKMPRWLSEGISVYEERQQNRTWGQVMNPQYRTMVLNGELTPIGKLSGAFLSPKSGLHVQFAYYESSLVVEFLIKNFGLSAVKNILRDLRSGISINDALERHTVPLQALEATFEAFAVDRANELAPNADWTKPDLPALIDGGSAAFTEYLEQHPNNFIALTAYATKLIADKSWQQAKTPLQKLIALHPDYTGGDNAYEMLAAVHRKLDASQDEGRVLEAFAQREANAVAANLRLLELHTAKQDWNAVLATAERLLAVNPLLPQPHRSAALAAEKLDRAERAISALHSLISLDTENLATAHYRLARVLHQLQRPTAKRHVLLALEDAPRFREALQLLLRIRESERLGTAALPPRRNVDENRSVAVPSIVGDPPPFEDPDR